MEQVENGMVMYKEKEPKVIGVCEQCGDYIYEDEEMYGFMDNTFHLECVSDYVDALVEKLN
ncbi:MAG: hypothetical protein ACRCX8_14430 [Sarcina sp.]